MPPGFIIGTAAYNDFVRTNQLAGVISSTLPDLAQGETDALEQASQSIRERFAVSQLDGEISRAIRAIYEALGRGPVAVRSSATAEDLPGYSFAGQQDTYLNVVGEEALLKALIDCWSSLWTARAIGYRAHNGIDHETARLAVIVQAMVPSETSGVLFTANPLTGKRGEIVIDAIYGLGEALVSGQVEPDHYLIDSQDQILSRTLGQKSTVIRGQESGGTLTFQQDNSAKQALPDTQILELARLGRAAASLFGGPQDIEWAVQDHKIWLLQSRPITTLYPVPEGISSEPLMAFLSFGAVQGMLDPMTPLGRDAIRGLFVGGARIFGARYSLEDLPTLADAGERLWVNFTGLLKNRLGRKIMLAALDYVEPGAKQSLLALIEEGSLPLSQSLRPMITFQLLRVVLPTLSRAVATLLRPEAQRDRLLEDIETWLGDLQTRITAAETPTELLALIRKIPADTFYFLLPQFVPRFGIGMAAYNLLTHLAAGLPGEDPDTRVMMRGLPENVTTEMDLALWQVSQQIRNDPSSFDRFEGSDPSTLAQEYLTSRLPAASQEAINRFLERYGVRGLGEIDLGRQRWEENPTPLMQALQSYLQIDDPALAPDGIFERGRDAAQAEIKRLVQALGKSRGGWLKARLAGWGARRMRLLTGLRETPKFSIIRLFAFLRRALLRQGEVWTAVGLIDRAEDVFYLKLAELDTLAAGDARNWKALIRSRQQSYQRESLRRQIPRLLLSDGRAFYGGISPAENQEENQLSGSPVSPGIAEGRVRVVLDPHQAQLQPGEILVCPGTDPSWTPLFLAAGGLVMEVGGMMTHGAVVAREYGIPAVVGVHQATSQLHTGQLIQVNGSSGQITILED